MPTTCEAGGSVPSNVEGGRGEEEEGKEGRRREGEKREGRRKERKDSSPCPSRSSHLPMSDTCGEGRPGFTQHRGQVWNE